MQQPQKTFPDLADILTRLRVSLSDRIPLFDNLVQLASMFDRVQPGQRQELISQFHDQAGRIPYIDDCDAGSLILERCADEMSAKPLRRFLYAEGLYRAKWCAQSATGPGEAAARSSHIERIQFKLSGIPALPGEIEISVSYSKHSGSRFEGAGLSLQFHYNQQPGIHFRVEPSAEYRSAIIKGIEHGMVYRFPNFPTTGSIWVTGINEHPVDSSRAAFYRAARSAVEQAYALLEISYRPDE